MDYRIPYLQVANHIFQLMFFVGQNIIISCHRRFFLQKIRTFCKDYWSILLLFSSKNTHSVFKRRWVNVYLMKCNKLFSIAKEKLLVNNNHIISNAKWEQTKNRAIVFVVVWWRTMHSTACIWCGAALNFQLQDILWTDSVCISFAFESSWDAVKR